MEEKEIHFEKRLGKFCNEVNAQFEEGNRTLGVILRIVRKIQKLEYFYSFDLNKTIQEELAGIRKSTVSDEMVTRDILRDFISFARKEINAKNNFSGNLQNSIVKELKTMMNVNNSIYRKAHKEAFTNSKKIKKKPKVDKNKVDSFLRSVQKIETYRINVSKKLAVKFAELMDDMNKKSSRSIKNILRHVNVNTQDQLKRFCDVLVDKTKNKKNGIFNLYIDELYEVHDNKGRALPRIIEDCCKSVKRLKGFKTEGIFRISCSQENLSEAKEGVENQSNYDFDRFNNPHVPAVLLKMFLKDMAEQLIPGSSQTDCLDFVDKYKSEVGKQPTGDLLYSFFKIFNSFPKRNKLILSYLSAFLYDLSKEVKTTKMNVDNLAMVFSPTIVSNKSTTDIYEIMEFNEKFKTFISYMIIIIGEKKLKEVGKKDEEDVKPMSFNDFMGEIESDEDELNIPPIPLYDDDDDFEDSVSELNLASKVIKKNSPSPNNKARQKSFMSTMMQLCEEDKDMEDSDEQ